MAPPRCPRCESGQVERHVELLEASDQAESVHATHRCLNPKCRESFRYTPPAGEPVEGDATCTASLSPSS